MNQKKYSKYLFFIIGLIIFLAAAYCGYEKLHYGFNFIDEGYHMTESWRMSKGDYLSDSKTGALMPYTLINSIIFGANPDITLLGFRKVQFLLTLCALLVFSICLYAVTRTYWYLPLIFSVFAFTGLDPTGMIANLNYYTYPHLFLILFLSFLIIGLYFKKPWIKYAGFIVSGCFLWAISFSLLYLGAVVLAPILLYIACRTLPIRSFSFTFKDLVLVLLPFAACWLLFIGFFAHNFIPAMLDAISFILSGTSHSTNRLLGSMSGSVSYIGISAIFFLLFYFLSKKSSGYLVPVMLAAVSVLFYFIIETSFFGRIQPYYNGWFGRPMWFSGLIMAFVSFFWGLIFQKTIRKKSFAWTEEIIIVLLLPVTIKSVCTIFFSGLDALTVLHSAIPAMAAFVVLLLHNMEIKGRALWLKFAIIVFALAPFYYTTSWADWQFTHFDVVPKQADTVIKKGFGKGIKTNRVYAKLYDWIDKAAAKYSDKDDFMISYIVSPMSHMIAKRRPALNHTFISFVLRHPMTYKNAVIKMKEQDREPAVAFIFERMPWLLPVSFEKGTVKWPQKQFLFKYAKDPISTYIKNNMELAGKFVVSKKNDHIISCYARPK